MEHYKGDQSCSTGEAIDLMSAVKKLHRLPSHELSKLLRDSGNITLQHHTEKGSSMKVDLEKLARILPVHLIAVLISSKRDEALFRYMLYGFRLLHSFCDLAPRYTKFEQILLNDVKVSEQLLDLVFYMLIVLGSHREENQGASPLPYLHSALVYCSLYLLRQCISPLWPELVPVLLAHPKVEIFMIAAFRAVYVDIKFLPMVLSEKCSNLCSNSSHTAVQVVNYLCQQYEASLQFLQLMCQQISFQERLIRNKELSCKGGVFLLAKAILKAKISPSLAESSKIVAAVSRIKSKVLSIMLHLSEVESISFLDEAFSNSRSDDLAKFVAAQVFELLRTVIHRDARHLSACFDKTYPMGLLQLNAFRLTNIFSDDSNLHSHVALHLTELLVAIFVAPHSEFLSIWCSSNVPLMEEDAAIESDAFAVAGWVLDLFSSSNLPKEAILECSFIPDSMPASYAHCRTSLLVKIIANLHCYLPKICKEHEKNFFLNKFLEFLQMGRPQALPEHSFTSEAQNAAIICKNLRSLSRHAESLIPIFLNAEDLQLFRIFFNQLRLLITPDELQ